MVRVRGDVVVDVVLDGERERRTGLKAVLRRWRDREVEGCVREKRFWRVVDILIWVW